MQAYIDKYRRQLPVVLVNSPHNSMKSIKRLKKYHEGLQESEKPSDGDADGDDDADATT